MKKILGVCFIVFISVVANAGQRPTSNALVVGMEGTFAPFNWIETRPSYIDIPEEFRNHPINGSVSWFGRGLYANGYDVWIARQIANDMGKDLVIEQIVWSGLIPALQLGHIDLIIAGMTPTPRRAEVINFSEEYHHVRNVLVVHNENPFVNASSLDDLVGARIVGQLGTLLDTLAGDLAGMVEGATHSVPLDSIPAILSNLSAGANDITILSYTVAKAVIGNDDNAEFVILDIPNPFELREYQERLGIGVRKGEDDLLAYVNRTLENFHNIEINLGLYENARDARTSWMDRSIETSLKRRQF